MTDTKKAKKRLGERLVERGSVSPKDLEDALTEQHGTSSLLGDLLLARGLVTKEDLAFTLKELLGIDYVDVTTIQVDRSVLKFIPRAVAVENSALPLYQEGKKLFIAMANPQNIRFLDQLRFKLSMDICPVLSFSDDISAAIDVWYGKPGKAGPDNARPTIKAPNAKALQTVSIARSSPELMHRIVTTEQVP